MSHHGMGAFFSSIDDAAIRQEATNNNHFLSLVVDTRGMYVARITRRLSVKQKIHAVITEICSYPSYNNAQVTLSESAPVEKDIENETTRIMAYDMKVERPVLKSDIPAEWGQAVTDAYKRKKAAYPTYPTYPYQTQPRTTFPVPTHSTQPVTPIKQTPADIYKHDIVKPVKEPELFPHDIDEVPIQGNDFNKDKKFSVSPITDEPEMSDIEKEEALLKSIKDEDVDYMVLQIVSGNLFASRKQIPNLQQYITKLPTMVQERFDTEECYLTMMTSYCEAVFTEYVVQNCFITDTEDILTDLVVEKVQERLDSIHFKNHLIEALAEQLNQLYI